ncbi:MltA domain-containing protein [Leeia sp. TBRC 13508]|uniref:peptidoglycan lytic exotransglycosylase n=1 Tax=Leeia speluncae TaxID=2884804 RepID=A0ABS8D3D0_9NEIS|nr:MltA domain-containing protein [Leeia speluncae]MCB6182178.1 MltA domain-containing protein [Leeia speluncae]
MAACSTPSVPPSVTPVPETPASKPAPAIKKPSVVWTKISDNQLPTDWQMESTLQAWQLGCKSLSLQEKWKALCAVNVAELEKPDWWKANFDIFQVSDGEGKDSGMLTGYYEPFLNGATQRSAKFAYPVYGVPTDLLTLDMATVYPDLKGARIRARLDGRKVVPYWSREEIELGKLPANTPVLAWVDDPVALFFLQVQGSGRIKLADGKQLRLGYADQNGYTYQSIGRELIKRGELTLDQASMQGIQAWAKRNPDKLQELLNTNPSYVFFRQLPTSNEGPIGSLNVPLTAGYSIAVDVRSVPLGTPVLIDTVIPNEKAPVKRLVMAQDTGGAIKGAVRADLFTGLGDAAGQVAGKMRQPLKYWVFWPKSAALPDGVVTTPAN